MLRDAVEALIRDHKYFFFPFFSKFPAAERERERGEGGE